MSRIYVFAHFGLFVFKWRHCNRQGKPLGRDERRWLSHYLSTADPIIPSAKDPMDVSTMLHQTLENADRLLNAARVDQKNIKQALKMTNAAAVLDDLEDLRWYVYPQECAQLLASQAEPDCSVPLKGPLNPNGKVEGAESHSLLGPTSDEKGAELDRKRKIEVSRSEITPPSALPSTSASNLAEGKVEFKDGPTSGVGTLAELDKRILDGELSDNCEILNTESGEWIRLRALLGTSKKQKTTMAQKAGPVSSTTKASFTKKEARDSSAWGMGAVTESNSIAKSSDPVTNGEVTQPGSKKSKNKHKKPPAKMMRLINQAIFNWDMIENGDRLLLGLSGGKDSLSLLHCLLEFRRKMPIDFELEICTIDPMTPSFDPSPLIPYVESMGLKYHYIRDDIVARAQSAGKDGKSVSSLCAFCARMKRGNLYSVARKNKCNKLVLAQVRVKRRIC